MMSKNSIVPFLKDYLIKFLTRPFLLDTNEENIEISCESSANHMTFQNITISYHTFIQDSSQHSISIKQFRTTLFHTPAIKISRFKIS